MEMLKSFHDTKANPETKICVYVADNDRSIAAYKQLANGHDVSYATFLDPAQAINALFDGRKEFDYYGIANDDYIYRTPGWDEIMIKAIEDTCGGWGMANSESVWPAPPQDNCRHPVGCVFSGNIPRLLGYIFAPTISVYRSDAYLRDLFELIGPQIDSHYVHCPEVTIEHMHFRGGKAAFDDTYSYGYNPNTMARGNQGFFEWERDYKQNDLEKIRKALPCVPQ